MYEIRAQYGPAKPAPDGRALRGPLHLWHICEPPSLKALCDQQLSSSAKTWPIEDWSGWLPGDVSVNENRRCAACANAYGSGPDAPTPL